MLSEPGTKYTQQEAPQSPAAIGERYTTAVSLNAGVLAKSGGHGGQRAPDKKLNPNKRGPVQQYLCLKSDHLSISQIGRAL